MQGFQLVKRLQLASSLVAATCAFGLAYALGHGIAPLSAIPASLLAGLLSFAQTLLLLQ